MANVDAAYVGVAPGRSEVCPAAVGYGMRVYSSQSKSNLEQPLMPHVSSPLCEAAHEAVVSHAANDRRMISKGWMGAWPDVGRNMIR